MFKQRHHGVLIASLTLIGGLLVTANSINADVANLKEDWGDAANPNGAWCIKKNVSELFAIWQEDYYQDGNEQGAWADDPFNLLQHVPVWFKSIDDGLIYTHGAEFDRTGSDYTAAAWTSNVSGLLRIDGRVWTVSNFGREMNWQVLVNGNMITEGNIVSNGSHSSENPFLFVSGSGGPGVLSHQVSVGDVIELGLTSVSQNGNLGESLGVEFSISVVGDVNCDGAIDLLDVAPFIDALSFGSYVPAADLNGDGTVNLLDVTPFVELLSG